jgi:hypothetical protein
MCIVTFEDMAFRVKHAGKPLKKVCREVDEDEPLPSLYDTKF